ncbi:MAG: DUF2680 domain-containing protein [Eubacteriales bacterium]
MKMKIVGVLTVGLLLVGATGVWAATPKTPAETYAGLKGITVEEAVKERTAGAAYGELASEAGILDDFQAQMLENKKAVIQDRVKDGYITQEEADGITTNIEENMANCDGTSTGDRIGQKSGMGFGSAARGSGKIGGGLSSGTSSNKTCNGTGMGSGGGNS